MGKRQRRVLFATDVTEHSEPARDEAPAADVLDAPADGDDDVPSSDDGEVDDDDDADVAAPPAKRRPHHKLEALALALARETAEVFKSNIFKLQTDELLQELAIKPLHVALVEKVLHRLHEVIQAVPDLEALLVSSAELFLDQVSVPWPEPKPTLTNYTFQYKKPELVDLVGLFGLKAGTLMLRLIDLCVTMPSELFQAKDYLNYRALYKRCFYVAWLAHHMAKLANKHHLPVKISYHLIGGDVLNPGLKIELVTTDDAKNLHFAKTKFWVQVMVALPMHMFEGKKLLPDKNCIRIQALSESLPPTPLYNALVVSLTTPTHYLRWIYTTKKQCDGFKDALMLGRTWLAKRGFSGNITKGGFGSFEWLVLMAALLAGGSPDGLKQLLHGFSLYQLFKGTIKYLAEVDLLNDGYLLFTLELGLTLLLRYKAEGFRTPTIFDKHAKLNVLWKMTPDSYLELREYARELLALLNDVVRDRFDALMLQGTLLKPATMQFDMVLAMDPTPVAADIAFGPLEKISYITFDNYLRHRVGAVLRAALGSRVTLMAIELTLPQSWLLLKRKPALGNGHYSICLRLNADEYAKQVTKGPTSADLEDDQSKFRGFWGSKALLRRFKDGVIQHCVVWNGTDKEPVVVQIAKYVLNQHVADGLGEHVALQGWDILKQLPKLTLAPGAGWAALRLLFDELARAVVGLDLPLRVKLVLPASSGLRQTLVLEPVPFAVALPDYWNDAVVQFEYLTRWPDELVALEKTKAALLLKMKAMLEDTGNWRGAMVEDDELIPFVTQTILQMALVKTGYGFALRVVTERDETMYLRAVQHGGASLKHVLQDVYLKFYRQAVAKVKHTRTVGGLVTAFPAFSETCRIIKRWFDAHLLLLHFGDELIELLVLKVFTDPAPFAAPHLAPSAVLQVLQFLATWNWKESPLILDLVRDANERDDGLLERLTVSLYKVIEDNFAKIRALDPLALKTQLFVGLKDDPLGILWLHDVLLPMALRMTALARAALQASSEQAMFTPVLGDYDFVLHLDKSLAPLAPLSGVMPPLAFKNLLNIPQSLPGDFSQPHNLHWLLFDDLERRFGQVVLFSTAKYQVAGGAAVVAGIFVPAYLAKRRFKPTLGFDIKPAGGDEVELNRDGVMAQVKRLGGELVSRIDVKN